MWCCSEAAPRWPRRAGCPAASLCDARAVPGCAEVLCLGVHRAVTDADQPAVNPVACSMRPPYILFCLQIAIYKAGRVDGALGDRLQVGAGAVRAGRAAVMSLPGSSISTAVGACSSPLALCCANARLY